MLELTNKSYRGELYFVRNEILCPISHYPIANPISIGNLLVGVVVLCPNRTREIANSPF